MKEFTDCLNQILKERNMNSAQVAQICGLDTSVVFRWLCGKSLPKSWRRLEIVVEKLRLTPYETDMLGHAYRKALLGETQSGCFDEILKTLYTLAEKRLESRQAEEENGMYLPRFDDRMALPVSRRLNSKMDLIQCVQTALWKLAGQEEEGLCLKLSSLPDWLVMQLKQFENRAKNPVEMFLCENDRDGMFQAAELKLRRMRQVIDLLIAPNPIQIYFYNALDELGMREQNWLATDRFVIWFSPDLSQGMMTRDAEWIAFFKENQKHLKAVSRQFCKCNKAVLEFLDKEEELIGVQNAAVDFMPCLSVGLTEEIVRGGILQELPYREEVIKGILCYPNAAPQMKQVYSCFQEQGLRKFMEYGVIDLFPYKVYRPLPMEERCEVLRNVISLQEKNTAFHYILLKEEFADMRGICVEQRHSQGDKLYLYFSYEEGEKEEILVLDPDIRKEYAHFFEYLRESSLACSEEETLAFMKRVLAEYQGKAV